MPLSALPFQVKRRNKNDTPLKHRPPQLGIPSSSPSTPGPEQPASFHERFLRSIRKHHQSNTNFAPAAEIEKPARPKIDMLQVSVLISMPSQAPNRPANYSTSSLDKADEDETIPDIAFGVCRLPYKPSEQPLMIE